VAFPRVQLFEFNDAPWAPAVLRETMISALSRALRRGRMLDGLVAPFTRFVERAATREVLDLCAGAGGPASILADALAREGVHVHFLMSDLFPHVEAWKALARESSVGFIAEPVDATCVSPAVGKGRARTIINALHHFPPSLAKSMLEGACADAPGVFIAEGLDRTVRSIVSTAVGGLGSLLATPLFVTHRLRSALYTWVTPATLAASLWDCSVSSLRCYSEPELRELVREIPGWTWEFGMYRHGPFGRGSYFMGWPSR
jgi:hypothetical protein